mgnify:CR=1 FL=1
MPADDSLVRPCQDALDVVFRAAIADDRRRAAATPVGFCPGRVNLRLTIQRNRSFDTV